MGSDMRDYTRGSVGLAGALGLLSPLLAAEVCGARVTGSNADSLASAAWGALTPDRPRLGGGHA